ncbi:di-heme oxidoredictase family protein [Vreelandella boliviensis]|uniref:di-heme oxidoreductase family protein n=1 Tax=Vreelandella boliviensis TaxID=223527 RepID=UPI001B8CDF8C|nr:di-heme oxidoredictase family protein [Halomonas boliviensis]MBS3666444.1 c-type cytochrome [Halomonas boliviensis]
MYRLPRFIVLAKWVPSTLAHSSFLLFLLAAPLQAAESPIQNAPPSQYYPIQTTPMSGGDGSVEQFDHNAYSLPLGNMSMTKRLDFSVGNSFFRNPWVAAPASTEARDGLGPLINTNSCQGCHLKDGRGHPPTGDENPIALFLRLSLPASQADTTTLEQRGALPVPNYGLQLQTAAISGAAPEGKLVIAYRSREVSFADGTSVTLQEPVYSIAEPAYGELPEDLQTSPRLAPPMIGLGLLEAIPEADLIAAADPDDADGDGISGRYNQVWDLRSGTIKLGRFGWKAGEPSIEQQSLHAFAGDMGLTSNLVPQTDCMESQGCDDFPNGGTPEVSDDVADFVTFYASSLAVPMRRNLDDPAVQQGAERFNALGCASCHTPRHRTAADAERPALADQIIWPYSDLLLHDMGDALADHRSEFQADGREWRTPPLWGIGLAQTVNPRAGFLHDGRARTLEEAILWHGGEAEEATQGYRELVEDQRAELIRFLESL